MPQVYFHRLKNPDYKGLTFSQGAPRSLDDYFPELVDGSKFAGQDISNAKNESQPRIVAKGMISMGAGSQTCYRVRKCAVDRWIVGGFVGFL